MLGLGKSGSPMFVVSSVRAKMPSEARPLRFMQAKMWEAKHMLPDDRLLCAQRMYTLFESASSEQEMTRIMDSIDKLDSIYGILEVMNKVLPTPTMAMFAANLAPAWSGTAEEEAALRQGLGLDPPSEDFWKPIGQLTSELSAEDKIWLLVDLVPAHASADKAALLPDLPGLVEYTQEQLKEKVPDVPNRDIQVLAVDLVVADYLQSPDPAGYKAWVTDDFGPLEALDAIAKRQTYKEDAKQQAKEAGLLPDSA